MEKEVIEQAVEIFNQLSPQNQTYMMALAKVACTAEDAVKKERIEQPHQMKGLL